MKHITVIGLGYVGYPLAIQAASKGYKVTGIDINTQTIQKIEQGLDPVTGHKATLQLQATTSIEPVSQSDVIIVCVPSPVDKDKQPDMKPIISAMTSVAHSIDPQRKPLIILESTINPGVMEEVVKPLFDAHTIGKDYFLGHCPERINPGDPIWNVSNIPRAVGAFTNEGTEKIFDFYSSIIDGTITKMSTVRAAEATKILENTFRDVNIAFINELARSFEVLDIDIMEVIKASSTKPFAFMPHYPGCGVGGHCIPVDPYYLIEKGKKLGFEHHFLIAARRINESMPAHTVLRLQDALNEIERSIKGTTVGLLGLSYKANVGDLRESPALKIKELLEKKGAKVLSYDPYVQSSVNSLEELQQKTDILLIATNHEAFKQLEFEKIRILIDGRNMFAKKDTSQILYKGIGTN